jgi:hypothetical protein
MVPSTPKIKKIIAGILDSPLFLSDLQIVKITCFSANPDFFHGFSTNLNPDVSGYGDFLHNIRYF